MALALQLHRELPTQTRVTAHERETRRRLFWACYLMDRFAASGTKRPSLIADESISLRLPSRQEHKGTVATEGDFFSNGPSAQHNGGCRGPELGSSTLLINICRILGTTNRYLAAGGMKGDPYLPWHSLSTLATIRYDLDMWAAESRDAFTSLETLFGQPDSTVLVLSKLVYHLVHCLIYRPFLPIDLVELSSSSQHQTWHIEATNLCFLHANAITELVEIGKASDVIEWPAFVGYCVCAAGTIHVHGVHYPRCEGQVFSTSAEFFAREMQQLEDLSSAWSGVLQQRNTLQDVYSRHMDLVRSLATSSWPFASVFQLQDFFDRYPGRPLECGHVTVSDIIVRSISDGSVSSLSKVEIALTSCTRPTNTEGNLDARDDPRAHTSSQYPILMAQRPFGAIHVPQRSRKRRRTSSMTRMTPPSPPSNPSINHPALPYEEPLVYHMPESNGDVFCGGVDNLHAFATVTSYGSVLGDEDVKTKPVDQINMMFGLPTPEEKLDSDCLSYDSLPTPYQLYCQEDAQQDPFLRLLQQMAETEQTRGTQSELDLLLGNR